VHWGLLPTRQSSKAVTLTRGPAAARATFSFTSLSLTSHTQKSVIETVIFKAGPCEPGYYQAGGPKEPCTVCGEDAYCAGGKLGKRVACPSGYSTAGLTIATTVEQCFVACDPGTYASIATGPAATCYSCGPGFFCAGGPQSACPSQISHGEGMAGVASFRYARVGRCFAPCLDEARKAFPSHPSHLISYFFCRRPPRRPRFL